ncbi:MAG TPA: hypothetical protein VKR57_05855 [Terriglobales bacterium]|nr:hypothetical protein [Terriglobales bacterium]
MKKLMLVCALLLTTSMAFADGSGLPPVKPPSTTVSGSGSGSGSAVVTSSTSSTWAAVWAWLTSRL